MCRILYLESKHAMDIQAVLKAFAQMAKNSREYQGHGWGCAWWQDDQWNFHWNIRPIWESSFDSIPSTTRLLLHARSAFRNRAIVIQNNMPFTRGDAVFIFNGELHGVRIREYGHTGAEKIFNFILRFYFGDLLAATQKALSIINKKSRYVRAMNFVLATRDETVLASQFNEQADYFTMHVYRSDKELAICSEPLELFTPWQPIANQTIEEIRSYDAY